MHIPCTVKSWWSVPFFSKRPLQTTKLLLSITINHVVLAFAFFDYCTLGTVAHILWVTWAICSRLLICLERSERIVHSRSFDLSKMSEWANSQPWKILWCMGKNPPEKDWKNPWSSALQPSNGETKKPTHPSPFFYFSGWIVVSRVKEWAEGKWGFYCRVSFLQKLICIRYRTEYWRKGRFSTLK